MKERCETCVELWTHRIKSVVLDFKIKMQNRKKQEWVIKRDDNNAQPIKYTIRAKV